jgi:hypothetical protein
MVERKTVEAAKEIIANAQELTASGSKRIMAPPVEQEVSSECKPPPAKKVMKEKELNELEKMKSFYKSNAKSINAEYKVVVPEGLYDLHKKKFANPDVVKAYILPLFHFLDDYSVVITDVHEFEKVVVYTMDGVNKIEKMRKLYRKGNEDESEIDYMDRKYGKKLWKIPKKDYGRVRKLLENGPVTIHLVDIDFTSFEDKNGNRVECMTPKLRYETYKL